MQRLLISGGPLLCLMCSARVRHCLRLLVGMGGRDASRLARLISCLIILTASSPVSVYLPLYSHPSLFTFAFRSREVKRIMLELSPYGGTDPVGIFNYLSEENV